MKTILLAPIKLIHSVRLRASAFHSTSRLWQNTDHPLYPKVDFVQVKGGKYAVVDPLDSTSINYITQREYLILARVVMSNDYTLVVLATPRDSPVPPHPSAPESSSDPDNLDPKNPPRAPMDKSKGYTRRLSHYFNASSRRFRVARLRLAFSSTLSKWSKTKVSIEKSMETLRPGSKKNERAVPMIDLNSGNAREIVLDWSDMLWFRFFGSKFSKDFGKACVTFGDTVATLVRNHGLLHCVLRLKIEAHAILRYIAGEPLTSTSELGMRIRLRNGLPVRLSSTTRQAIRSGNIQTIRLWLSIYNIYRAISAPHPQPSLGAITLPRWDEGKSAYYQEFDSWCKLKLGMDFSKDLALRSEDTYFRTTEPYASSKAGPLGPSLLSARGDLLVWYLRASREAGYFSGKVINAENSFVEFQRWLAYVQTNQDSLQVGPLWNLTKVTTDRRLRAAAELLLWAGDLALISSKNIPKEFTKFFEIAWDYSDGVDKPRWAIVDGIQSLALARLIPLREPAGKVRNIVTFDWWSQQALLPIHKFLMGLLKRYPSDATFDQQTAVETFSRKGFRYIASYDLSTATERIPQQLYQSVMRTLLGAKVAEAWLPLLVDRDVLPHKDYWVSSHASTFRFSRGQPMGALSSWPAMALVHHAIVRFAADLVGVTKFEDYLVLGDDIVIGNELVADTYRKVSEDLGLKIGLAKSFVSRKGFGNFAAQSFLGDINLSPLSASEELAIRGPAPRVEMALRSLRRGFWTLSDSKWMSSLLRQLLPRSGYDQVVNWRRRGKVDPLVKASFMAALGVPQRIASLMGNPGFSVRSFFAGLNLTLKIFSLPLNEYFSRYLSTTGDTALISAILIKNKMLDRKFSALRAVWISIRDSREKERRYKYLSALPESLMGANPWLSDIISMFKTFDTVIEDFEHWRNTHGRFIRMLAVGFSDGDASKFLMEHTMEMSIDEIYARLCEAEETMPTSLDYLLGGEVPSKRTDPLAGYRSLDRLLGHLEHLVESSIPIAEADPLSEELPPEVPDGTTEKKH